MRAANAELYEELDAMRKGREPCAQHAQYQPRIDHYRLPLRFYPQFAARRHRHWDAGKDRLALSDKLDKVLTNALLGPIIMIGVLHESFQVTFTLGAYPQGWVEDGFAMLGEVCTSLLPEGLAQSLIVDGVIAGVGGVVSCTR